MSDHHKLELEIKVKLDVLQAAVQQALRTVETAALMPHVLEAFLRADRAGGRRRK